MDKQTRANDGKHAAATSLRALLGSHPLKFDTPAVTKFDPNEDMVSALQRHGYRITYVDDPNKGRENEFPLQALRFVLRYACQRSLSLLPSLEDLNIKTDGVQAAAFVSAQLKRSKNGWFKARSLSRIARLDGVADDTQYNGEKMDVNLYEIVAELLVKYAVSASTEAAITGIEYFRRAGDTFRESKTRRLAEALEKCVAKFCATHLDDIDQVYLFNTKFLSFKEQWRLEKTVRKYLKPELEEGFKALHNQKKLAEKIYPCIERACVRASADIFRDEAQVLMRAAAVYRTEMKTFIQEAVNQFSLEISRCMNPTEPAQLNESDDGSDSDDDSDDDEEESDDSDAEIVKKRKRDSLSEIDDDDEDDESPSKRHKRQ